MRLEGSCHCGAVKFSLQSSQPVPYMRCYCSICRKTNGSGGYSINLGGEFNTLKISGDENISVYQATPSCERRFCKLCGSGLWVYSPDWPDLVHPFASAIDTDLPAAPEHTHIMLQSKAAWVPVGAGTADERFDAYPDKSLVDWHMAHGFSF